MFDLGGVVVDYQGVARMHAMLDGACDPEEIRRNWSASPLWDDLETGRITPNAFAVALIEEWRLGIAPQEFLDDFKTWPVGAFDGAVELIARLKHEYLTACLSNINPLHWDRNRDLKLDGLFEHKFLSYEMGVRKPDPEIFHATIDKLGIEAEEIIFFDDLQSNIEAAHNICMKTQYWFRPMEGWLKPQKSPDWSRRPNRHCNEPILL